MFKQSNQQSLFIYLFRYIHLFREEEIERNFNVFYKKTIKAKKSFI